MATSFSLLETILYEPEKGFYLVDGHIERLQRSVKQFQEARVGNFQEIPSADAVKCALKQAVENTSGHQRLRLLYDGQQLTVQTADFTPSIHNAHDTPNEAASSDEAFKITLDTVPLQSQTTDLFITCKTTYRDMYNTARERVRAGQDGLFDVVLWNQDGQVTETSIANITLRKHGRWVTPKLASGLLPGVLRQHLLDHRIIIEDDVTLQDIQNAQQNGDPIVCLNSVRKAYRVELV